MLYGEKNFKIKLIFEEKNYRVNFRKIKLDFFYILCYTKSSLFFLFNAMNTLDGQFDGLMSTLLLGDSVLFLCVFATERFENNEKLKNKEIILCIV